MLTLMIEGGIHQLNLVGAEIWIRINKTNTVSRISHEVAGLFGWNEEETVDAVVDFLRGLAMKGWVDLTS